MGMVYWAYVIAPFEYSKFSNRTGVHWLGSEAVPVDATTLQACTLRPLKSFQYMFESAYMVRQSNPGIIKEYHAT